MSLEENIKKYINKLFGVKADGEVVVRIPPSPTGNLHIGTARTALFNYLFARQKGGKIVMRIEDTDTERSKPEFEENIKAGLEWLEIDWDEFYRQSERSDIYKKYLEELISKDKAYVSQETPKEEGQRSEVIRFRNPNKKVKFIDLIRGEIEFDTTELEDFVIAKSLDEPLYHLAVVVDDHEMNITHIVRGEDHISNTPRQILLQEAIGAKLPQYAHLPLILNKDKTKMSKRENAVSVFDYKDMGYSKEALVNYIATLGWAPKDEKEIFSMEELIQNFRIEDVQKGGAVFNLEKLDWFNKEWIKRIPDGEFEDIILANFEINEYLLKRALPEIKNRVEKIKDLENLFDIGGDFDYLITLSDYDEGKLNWKNNSNETSKNYLLKILSLLGTLTSEDFVSEKIKETVFPYADQEGRGDVLWPYRFALSGKDKSIDPFTLSYILGKDETVKRIENAIQKLG